jgi:glycosyltransferase involved in cell wall biosynthesis
MNIALVGIMQNEAAIVDQWIAGVRFCGLAFSEVLVVDGGSRDNTSDRLRAAGVKVLTRPVDGDFAAQRNFACSQVTADWILEVDADEIVSEPLVAATYAICIDAERDGVDVFGIPRLNFIDGALVASPGAQGLDYQYRLHRNTCRWEGRVHEELRGGVRNRVELRIQDGRFLVHSKSTARHEARNDFWRVLER